MNNRILELAEQADEYADTKLQMPGEYHPDWHDVRDEKFAELIVRECVDVLMRGDRYRRDYFANKVKEHFGVE